MLGSPSEELGTDPFHALTSSFDGRTPEPDDDELLAALMVSGDVTNRHTVSDQATNDRVSLLARSRSPEMAALTSFNFGTRPQPASNNTYDMVSNMQLPVQLSSDGTRGSQDDWTADPSQLVLEVENEQQPSRSPSPTIVQDQPPGLEEDESPTIVTSQFQQGRESQRSQSATTSTPSQSKSVSSAGDYPQSSIVPQKRTASLEPMQQQQPKRRFFSDLPAQQTVPIITTRDKSAAQADARAVRYPARSSSDSRYLVHTRATSRTNDRLASPRRTTFHANDDMMDVDKREMNDALQILTHSWGKAQTAAVEKSQALSRELSTARKDISQLQAEIETLSMQKATAQGLVDAQRKREMEQRCKVDNLTCAMEGLKGLIDVLRQDAKVQRDAAAADHDDITVYKKETSEVQDKVIRSAKKSQKLNNKMVKVMRSMKSQLESSHMSAEYLLAQLEEKTGLLVESRDELQKMRAQHSGQMQMAMQDVLKPLEHQMCHALKHLTTISDSIPESEQALMKIQNATGAIEAFQKAHNDTAALLSLTGKIMFKLEDIEQKSDTSEDAQLILDIKSLKQDILKVSVAVDDHKELQDRNAKLVQTIVGLQTRLDNCRDENIDLHIMRNSSDNVKASLQQQMTKLTDSLSTMAKGEGKTSEERIAIITNRMSVLESTLELLEAANVEYDETVDTLEESLAEAEHNLLKAEQAGIDKDKDLAMVRKKLFELPISIARTQSTSGSSNVAPEYRSTESFGHCHKEILDIIEDLGQRIICQQAKSTKHELGLQSSLNRMTKELDVLQGDNMALQTQITALETGAQDVHLVHLYEMSLQQARVGELLSQIGDLEMTARAAEFDSAIQANEIALLKAEVSSKLEALNAAKASASDFSARVEIEKDIVRGNMLELGRTLAITQRRLREATTEATRLQRDLEQARRQNDTIEEYRLELAFAEEQLLVMDEVKQRLADAELELLDVASLKQDLAYKEEQLVLAKEAANKFKEDVDKMREREQYKQLEEVSSLKAQVETLQAATTKHQESVNDQVAKLTSAETTISNLVAQRDTSEALLSDLTAKLTNMEKEAIDLMADQMSAHVDVERLQNDLLHATEDAKRAHDQSTNDKTTISELVIEQHRLVRLNADLLQETQLHKAALADLTTRIGTEAARNKDYDRLKHELLAANATIHQLKSQQQANTHVSDPMLPVVANAKSSPERTRTPEQEVNEVLSFLSNDTQMSSWLTDKPMTQITTIQQTPQNMTCTAPVNAHMKHRRSTHDENGPLDDLESMTNNFSVDQYGSEHALKVAGGDAVSRAKKVARASTMTDFSRGKHNNAEKHDWSDMLLSSNTVNADGRQAFQANVTPVAQTTTGHANRSPLKPKDTNGRVRPYRTRNAKQNRV